MPQLLALTFKEQLYINLIAQDRWLALLKGLGVTVIITIFAIIIGTILGTALAFGKMSKIKPLKAVCSTYITIIRGTPTLVQLLLIYFGVFGGFQISSNPDINSIVIASIAFGLNSAAYVAEIVRAGVQGVDPGQMEAGRSLGLNNRQTMTHIILPQAVKNILPTYTSEFIVLIKETAIVGYIGLADLTKVGDTIRSRTFSAWIPLLTVAIIYLCLTSALAKLFSLLERRLRESDKR